MDLPVLQQFNPLSNLNLGKSIANALNNSPLLPLGGLKPFIGAGVYAIYFKSADPNAFYHAYSVVNQPTCEHPIYVGKAIPPGGRKGIDFAAETQGTALFKRLGEHAASIKDATNLHLSDFWCRFLCLDSIWIPLGETLIISQYAPLWNIYMDGFGNHDPGSGRRHQKRSDWDMIHPGRAWAAKLVPQDPDAVQQLQQRLASVLNNLS